MRPMLTTGERFERAVSIMTRLRAPGGCPWDREQTFDSIKPYTLEETYEVLEAIDNRDWSELPGELGDVLLQVLLYSQMAKQAKDEGKPESVLAGVSSAMPALLEAHKLSSRAAHVGFDWPDMDGLFDKLHEETEELFELLKKFPEPGPRPLHRGVAGAGRPQIPEELREKLEGEVGDIFFVIVNV